MAMAMARAMANCVVNQDQKFEDVKSEVTSAVEWLGILGSLSSFRALEAHRPPEFTRHGPDIVISSAQ